MRHPAVESTVEPTEKVFKKIGLEGIIAVESRLSCVDGASGLLLVAGEPMEELAGKVP